MAATDQPLAAMDELTRGGGARQFMDSEFAANKGLAANAAGRPSIGGPSILDKPATIEEFMAKQRAAQGGPQRGMADVDLSTETLQQGPRDVRPNLKRIPSPAIGAQEVDLTKATLGGPRAEAPALAARAAQPASIEEAAGQRLPQPAQAAEKALAKPSGSKTATKMSTNDINALRQILEENPGIPIEEAMARMAELRSGRQAGHISNYYANKTGTTPE
jgi:hypothetical protein